MSLSAGTKLGPYEILSPLGAGGMGEVYRARDTRLGRDVAVKVLPHHLSSNSEVRARFEREAKTVSSLNHPHICTLFDVGREGDTDYLVMELIEGETLATRIEKGPLPLPELLRIGVQMADALGRAHRAGVVHRDLKPGNIMLTKSGAKLMDFGLARATGLAGSGSSATMAALTQSPTIAQPLTAEGTIVGTFQYMSPEQLEGKESDTRSDVWSFGCVLYEMATGKRAFEGKSQASLIAAILEHEPEPIAKLQPMSPPALERLVRACLAKDPDDRVQTAQDVKLHLEWLRAEGSSTTGTPGAPAARGKRGAIRARWTIVALPLLLAAAYFAGRSTAPNSGYAPPQFERKTYQDQSIFNARFMPDGKTLALSAALRGNRPRLFVIRPDYPEAQMIVDADLHLLGVSSRGELLVLNRARYTGHHRLFRGTLARMPLEGGAPRDIMDDVREADWAPDGESIAIIREVGGRDRLEFPVGKALYEAAGYLSDLRVSPRGDRIAFMEHPAKFDDRGSVNVVDLDGKSRILTGGYWGMEGLAWARDGKSVLFSATTNGSDYVVHEVDLAGRMRATQENVGLVTIHDVAPDGTWAVTRDDLPVKLAFRPAGATDEIDLSWLDSALEPMLTPDAKTVVFTDQSVVAGPNYAVTLRPSTGGAIVRLGEGMGADLSPDGKSVLAILYTTPPRLMSYPTGVGEPKQLDRGGFETITSAEWTNDGSRILVSGNETGQPPRCFLLDPVSGKLDPIGAEDIWDGAPAPDGLSFIARTRAGWSVHSMAGVTEGRAIPSMTPRDYLIRWSPDASAVYTFQRGEVPSPVDRINVATGERETVTTLGDATTAGVVGIVAASMADDMQSIAYGKWIYSSVLYTITYTK